MSAKQPTCWMLIEGFGPMAGRCITCGRRIRKRTLRSGSIVTEHVGPSVAQKLHKLNRKRGRAG